MKKLRQICLGFLLLLALSIPVVAGDVQAPALTCVAGEIGCPGVTGPQESPGVTGDVSTPGITGEIGTPGVTGDVLTPGFIISLILAGLF
ncbi:MAG: hypothetical protein H7Z16_17455 [Pyrinomonadaceae bacterium]|nr:hypothetical protein [Pyrinomonadaceae bacterium]